MGVEDEGKSSSSRDDQQQQYQYQYGTFQGVASYQHPPRPPPPPPPHQSYQHHQQQQPVIGFPQPAPPPGATLYAYGYQGIPVQGYDVHDERPLREHHLPCCGIGFGWFLFITGFFLGVIPWYIGAFLLLCARVDHREKPGYVACMIGTILALIAISLGVTKQNHAW